MSKVVYLMYELEQRELRSRFFIASRLLNMGYKVSIFQHKTLALIAVLGKPGPIYLKSTSYENDAIIKLLSSRGFSIYLWSEEGLHHSKNQSDSLTFSKNSSRFIHRYAAWHDNDFALAEKQGIKSNSIDIVGNVRMELAVNVAGSRELRKERNRVLVATNFDLNGFNYGLKNSSNVSSEYLQSVGELLETQKESSNKNVEIFSQLVKVLISKGFQVTLRPHYHDVKTGLAFDAQILDKNQSVYDSLAGVDFVVTYGSTISVEATLAGLPSVILNSNISQIDSRILSVGKAFNSSDDTVIELERLRQDNNYAATYINSARSGIKRNYGPSILESKHLEWITSTVTEDRKLSISLSLIARIGTLLKYLIGLAKKRLKTYMNHEVHIPKARKLTTEVVVHELNEVNALNLISDFKVGYRATNVNLLPKFIQ